MSMLFNSKHGKNWIYVTTRIVMLLAFSLVIYITKPRDITSVATVMDILVPLGVGMIGLIVISLLLWINGLRVYAPYFILPYDWALVGVYVHYIDSNNTLLITGVITAIIASGILRLGSLIGFIQAVGCIIAAIVALSIKPDLGFNNLMVQWMVYAPIGVFAGLFTFLTAIWYNTLDENNTLESRNIRKQSEETQDRLSSMRERSRAFAEMAAMLTSTLNYDRILDAAMDVSRISIRQDPKQRIISIALMVVDDDNLEIATARGLAHGDLTNRFKGTAGIIAQALDEGEPIIAGSGAADPELGRLNAFANIKTTLCIPLRANFETYGVLIFGSTIENAFNEDRIDTLAAIGLQTTIALQNAVLYGNLMDEKERIIRIEENGRKALVRDLHDIPTQTISAVAMHLSTIPRLVEKNPERLNAEIENIRQMALRATEEIRHVLFSLRPLSLEAQGLGIALNQLSQKMKTTYKQPMQAKVDPRVEEALNKDAQGTLFYLVEEAANNARKYAEANMITVQVGIQDAEVVLKVRDNGKGFDLGNVSNDYANRGSFGMVNMRERAELINGSFDLQSAPGKGTLITVRVPIEDRYIPNMDNKPTIKPRRAMKRKKQYTGPLSPGT